MALGPSDPPAAEPHFGTPTQFGYRFSGGGAGGRSGRAPSATCRAVNDWCHVVLAQACRDCRTSASPARGEAGPVLRCVHVDRLPHAVRETPDASAVIGPAG